MIFHDINSVQNSKLYLYILIKFTDWCQITLKTHFESFKIFLMFNILDELLTLLQTLLFVIFKKCFTHTVETPC